VTAPQDDDRPTGVRDGAGGSGATGTAATVRTVRERRPLRTLGGLLTLLAFIAALLWGSDYLSRVGAQSLIARAVQREADTPLRPSVHVRGAFFLPQVVRGRYDHVEIDAGPIESGPLRIAGLHADLRGVHLPFHDVLVRHVNDILVDSTAERATLLYRDIDAYLRSIHTPLTISYAYRGTLKLTGAVNAFGRSIAASADVRPTLVGDVVELTPEKLDSGNSAVDAVSRLLLGTRLTVPLPLTSLPFGQTLTAVSVRPGGVLVSAAGHSVVLGS
jgi:LmeA-like phospholipid-binding